LGRAFTNIYIKKHGKSLADEKVLEGIAKIFEEEGSDSGL
jgi:hypothetical protein